MLVRAGFVVFCRVCTILQGERSELLVSVGNSRRYFRNQSGAGAITNITNLATMDEIARAAADYNATGFGAD